MLNNQTPKIFSPRSKQLVILAYGNPSRGDDALGPHLLHQMEILCQSKKHIEFIEDFQLQVEHVLDLENSDLLLFIDANVSCPPPFEFIQLQAKQDITYTSHALHPAAVLYAYQQVYHQLPPPAFLLTVRGEAFELGEPLSKIATLHLTATFEFVKRLCQNIDVNAWQQWVTLAWRKVEQ
ncbi:HoxW protein [Thioploca ingrica]|uniref:HoxW protein n=1 Tax=Thioploca ingrica TaxID=40754 RepID=A0A090BVW4_9GAMM|nr:HoxW protein [Thioploca ingrica]